MKTGSLTHYIRHYLTRNGDQLPRGMMVDWAERFDVSRQCIQQIVKRETKNSYSVLQVPTRMCRLCKLPLLHNPYKPHGARPNGGYHRECYKIVRPMLHGRPCGYCGARVLASPSRLKQSRHGEVFCNKSHRSLWQIQQPNIRHPWERKRKRRAT